MDVNIANGSVTALSRDGGARLADKQLAIANSAVAVKAVQNSSDTDRSDEKVNQASQVDSDELLHAVDDIASSMNLIQKGLAFKVDEESGEQVVKVIDVLTGDLIRQIPNEEALEIAKKLNEVTGLLMKTQV
ncbi:flagellar protein FlaG [Shewanella sp. Isolate11]|uniref:flagellar protein FlaG n=1 Tax=Shewanella sp. Isolate11 TaxID=2908530 RepID=UPI001EFD813F|nr:flagellar protein FlaG [Shewanella sp. Isolate11]MCG9697160.1 flagellar protein FlaG [Shewanella sp. Isolate11]